MTILAWLNSHKKQIIVAALTIIVVIFLVAGLRWPPENMSETGRFLTLVAVVIFLSPQLSIRSKTLRAPEKSQCRVGSAHF